MLQLLLPVGRALDKLLKSLAAAAAVALGSLFAFLVYEVSMRAAGLRPPICVESLSEYVLLYSTALAAPWLLRTNEHVAMVIVTMALPRGARKILERTMALVGAIVCLIVCWYALKVTISVQGLEIRSFEMPRWMVYAPLPVGFFLLALEFLRKAIPTELTKKVQNSLTSK